MTIIQDVALYTPQLLAWRNDRAYSQVDLAKLARVSPTTIIRLEQGYSARPSTVRKLAAALGCEPRDLMAEAETDDA